jgi:hypothetical protein
MTMINVNLTPHSCEATRTRAIHSILLFLLQNSQVHLVVTILVAFYSETAGSSIFALQVTLWLHVSFDFTQISSPSLRTDATFMSVLGVRNTGSSVGTERVFLILVQARLTVTGSLVLTTQPGIGLLIGVSRVAIAHGISVVIVNAFASIVAILPMIRALLDWDLTSKACKAIRTDTMLSFR